MQDLLYCVEKLFQLTVFHFVLAVDLPDHKLAVGVDNQPASGILIGFSVQRLHFLKALDQCRVFSDVVGYVS